MANPDHCDRLLAIIDAQNEIIGSELDSDSVMRLVAETARSLTGADAATIELAHAGEMACAGVAGTADPDSEAAASVPIRRGEAAIGSLKIFSAAPRPFGEADEQALELLAGLVAAHLAPAGRVGGEYGDDLRDAVTELPNARSFGERLALEAERARRYRYPLALVLLEIDGLRAVYEELGERAGEEVLREIADLLSGSRFADEAFRVEESRFAILLPHTDAAGAEAAAARLAMQISAAAVADGRVTASWGAASGEEHPSVLEERAARALVAARDGEPFPSAG